MPGFIYLASPYSHPDPAVRDMRYMRVRDIAARLILERWQSCFSPIVHGHDMCAAAKAPFSYGVWREQDEAMLRVAEELWVVMMPGWRESAGIKAEIAYWRSLGWREMYLDPDTLETFNSPPVAA